MSPEHKERLRKVALIAVPTVLGGMAVRNVHERSQTRHISYWEASKTFIIDLMEDGKQGIRVSGRVLHGPGGRQDVMDVELQESFEYTDEQVGQVEEAFTQPVDDRE